MLAKTFMKRSKSKSNSKYACKLSQDSVSGGSHEISMQSQEQPHSSSDFCLPYDPKPTTNKSYMQGTHARVEISPNFPLDRGERRHTAATSGRTASSFLSASPLSPSLSLSHGSLSLATLSLSLAWPKAPIRPLSPPFISPKLNHCSCMWLPKMANGGSHTLRNLHATWQLGGDTWPPSCKMGLHLRLGLGQQWAGDSSSFGLRN